MTRESLEAREIVRGGEHVEVRQRSLHPAREWLVRRAPEQRVQPNDAADSATQIAER
jgi:hypothetical protein